MSELSHASSPSDPPPAATGEGIARDAETLVEVLNRLEWRGYDGQFRALDGTRVKCLTCHHEYAASDLAIRRMTRLEGASDPADMLVVMGIVCPRCAAKGTLVLNYGPDSTVEEADVLVALDDQRRGPGVA